MSLDQIRFDEPQAGLTRLAARFGGHAYDLHRHETYAVGLTLWGAQSFHYRGTLPDQPRRPGHGDPSRRGA